MMVVVLLSAYQMVKLNKADTITLLVLEIVKL